MLLHRCRLLTVTVKTAASPPQVTRRSQPLVTAAASPPKVTRMPTVTGRSCHQSSSGDEMPMATGCSSCQSQTGDEMPMATGHSYCQSPKGDQNAYGHWTQPLPARDGTPDGYRHRRQLSQFLSSPPSAKILILLLRQPLIAPSEKKQDAVCYSSMLYCLHQTSNHFL